MAYRCKRLASRECQHIEDSGKRTLQDPAHLCQEMDNIPSNTTNLHLAASLLASRCLLRTLTPDLFRQTIASKPISLSNIGPTQTNRLLASPVRMPQAATWPHQTNSVTTRSMIRFRHPGLRDPIWPEQQRQRLLWVQ